jgi:tetratricopeptide (TPR) repeat protein
MLSPAHGKISFAPGTGWRCWPLSSATYLTLVWATLLVLCFFFSPAACAGQERGQTPDITIVPKPINDTLDAMRMRDANKNVPPDQKAAEIQDSCLLPPLALMRSPIVSATALAVPSKARKEYEAACAALKQKKNESAEKHLRKAVQIYPKYSAALVTLGQFLAAQNRTGESRSACARASASEPNYLPAYLCLAELAAREKDWSVVSQLSEQVLALDPSSIALAYEYNAAANLRLNKLDDAEKSALRALEIDKNNIDPRVHFLLAQIYEAKGDRSKEVFQLHEYVKSAANTDDIAAVKDYLPKSEKHDDATDPAPQKSATVANSVSALPRQTAVNAEANNLSPGEAAAAAKESDASAESDSVAPGCNLQDVLPQIEHRVQEFVDNVQQFTATELLVQESFDGSGRVARTQQGKYNYLVSIEEAVAGMLSVSEYQGNRSSSGAVQTGVVTKGLPALLLIFHPYYAADFSMRCEGLTLLKRNPVWQIRFRQRDDKPNRIRSYKIGSTGPAYEINLQGRAWFTADDYQIVKLEADLIKTIPEIQLTVDHTSAEYGPVHFQSRGIDIWLPQAADLVSERKGKRYHERIAFSDYLLFAVDNKQDIASPKPQQWLSGSELCGTPSVCDWNRLFSNGATAQVTQAPD